MHPLQIISVIVVIRSQDQFLLVQRDLNDEIFPGKWQNLGGKVELGETIELAIKREVKEEVDLDVDQTPIFLQSYSWKKDEESPTRLGIIFLLELDKAPNEYKIQPDQELADFKWLTLEETKEMNNKDLLIGKDSPTGTYGQLSQADSQFSN